ncbi:MAG: aminoglycoside phosphotransferase family protein [Actinomycetota bacterium]|nr:aminoglycoside phosphotransferase family protein [Actinomycetota bacterium]
MTEEEWRTRVRAVVLHPSRPEVLVLGEDRRPLEAEVPERVWYAETPKVLAALRGTLDLAVLRLLASREDTDAHLLEVTLLCAPREGSALPSDARWVDRSCLPELHELDGDDDPSQPWTREPWLPSVERWLRATLPPLGYQLRGRAEQHKVWELSCVLRQPTDRGDVYVKANLTSPLLVDEAAILPTLTRLFPAHVAAPLAVEAEHGWLVTADFGTEVGWTAPVEVRQAVVEQFAQLQLASIPYVGQLIRAGCLDRRPAWLAAQLPLWCAAELTGQWVGPDVAARLQAAVPGLVELCGELEADGLPATLAHGDMHMSNVAQGPDGYRFFDWTDACVAHPFVDLIAVGHEEDAQLRERLLTAYLAQWTSVAALEDLRRSWAMAEVLSKANQAISYMSLGLSLRRTPTEAPHPLFASWTGRWLQSTLTALDRLRTTG